MPIEVACSCGKQYRLKEEMAGKKFRCKGCEKILTAQSVSAAAPAPAKTAKPARKKPTQAAATEFRPRPTKKRRKKKKPVDVFDDGYRDQPFGALDDFGGDYGDDYSDSYGEDDNPYAAPKSKSRSKKKKSGRSGAPLTMMQKLFSFEGRLSRGDYWLCNFLLNVVSYGVSFGAGAIAESVSQQVALGILVVVLLPTFVLTLWSAVAIIVKRLHDRDKAGWLAFLIVVPFANLWIAIECAFLAGTPGRNDYGPEPG